MLPVFAIRIYNFKINSIVGETLANNIECPTFQDRLYQIQIAGNNKI